MLLFVGGCASMGNKTAYCQNVYLDPVCIQARKDEVAQRKKQNVPVCEVTGSRIKRVPERCVEMKREEVKRAIETGG